MSSETVAEERLLKEREEKVLICSVLFQFLTLSFFLSLIHSLTHSLTD